MPTEGDLQARIEREVAHLAELDRQRGAATARLAALRAQLSEADGDVTPMTAAQKVALFRRLFAGRPDVYALRWENTRSGRTGYAPACRNEWLHGVCEKPRVRCGDCTRQAFIPYSDEVVRAHLQGRLVAGVYPLLADDTCWFCAIDLDGPGWREDATTVVAASADLGVTMAVERSRSGNGAHAWVFFSEAVPAVQARRLAEAVITEASARRPGIGLSSYDRVFPSRDVAPRGGFGNLIALPLQRAVRPAGCTVFLDHSLEPHPDQWALLAGVPRLDRSDLQRAVRRAADRQFGVLGVADEAEHPDEPWRAQPRLPSPIPGPFPESVQAVLAQQLYVDRAGLHPRLYDRIRRLAAFANPVFYERQRLRLSTALVPRVIACATEHPNHLGLPRGCLDDLRELIGGLGITLQLDDRRSSGTPLPARFLGELRADQQAAVDALADHETGVLVAPPGAGKTAMAAALIARRQASTLVVVPTRELMRQWEARLAAFLDLGPGGRVGVIGGGRRRPTRRLDVAIVQSLVHGERIDPDLAEYGHIVVDECHHVPAVSTERLLAATPALFVLGLTATPSRRDGHQPIIRMQCGPTRATLRSQPALALHVVTRTTEFVGPSGLDAGIQQLYQRLSADDQRNHLIVADTVAALREGRSPLVLTARRDHLERLAALLAERTDHLCVLHGGLRATQRKAAMERLTAGGEPAVVIATGRYLGEGFDHPPLDTLLLALPVAWKGTITQYAGRLNRPAPGKRDARIYDYVDRSVPMLAAMFTKRERAYRSLGYRIDGDPDLQPPDDPDQVLLVDVPNT